MRIGYVMVADRGETNRVLSDVAQQLQDRGLALAGAVQFDTECADGGKCDMDLRILPDGPVVRISQDLGAESKGCRLNPEALEQSVQATEAGLDTAQVVIINKFGKHEAHGRGFRETIAKALAHDVPVLVGVNNLNLPAFLEFVGDAAEPAGESTGDVVTWLNI